jgi:membrane protease YdiL (CAAX protease family)
MQSDERDLPSHTNSPDPREERMADSGTSSTAFCRRCGETSVPVRNCCPWCGAWLVGEPPRVAPIYEIEEEKPERDWHSGLRAEDFAIPAKKPSQLVPILVVIGSYIFLLGSLVMFIFVAIVTHIHENENDMMAGMAVVEILDAVMTVAALAFVWKSAKQVIPDRTRLITWLIAIPILAALLAVNILFVTYLRELFKQFNPPQPEVMKVTLVSVLLICVQPAIIEELFFRQMVLGVFRKSMNLHLAVGITAAMFSFAHLGNPIGMPYLFLAGVVFCYARVFGGLTLAMVMHFIHNFVVIAYEAWK